MVILQDQILLNRTFLLLLHITFLQLVLRCYCLGKQKLNLWCKM